MKIGIVGSREYPNKERVINLIEKVLIKFSNDILWITGDAKKGVDKWVREWVEKSEKYDKREDLKVKKPEFRKKDDKQYDVKDFHKRNKEIAESSDIVFAFQYNNSKGTQSTIDKCNQINTPVFVYNEK
ncbi:MAG: hypothetical protein ACOCP8_02185 [archaeon]